MFKTLFMCGVIPLSSLLLTALPAIAATIPVTESDRLQTATSSVEAQLSYTRDSASGILSDFRVRIVRNNQGSQEFRFPSHGELYGLPISRSEYGASVSGTAADVKVLDLDANGEPEVLVDLADPGLARADCNASSFIYQFNRDRQQYTATSHVWGNCSSSYWQANGGSRELMDLNGDRTLEFVARDGRFLREFTGYANRTAPIQIWRYQQGRMVDVTRAFPDRVYQNAYTLWNNYRQIRSRSGAQAARAPMAAYVGAKFLLGQREDAMQRLRQAYPGQADRAFVEQVADLMLHTGYYAPQSPPRSNSSN